jgi:hypothetical protein
MELAMEDLLRSGKAIPLDTVSAEAIDIAV